MTPEVHGIADCKQDWCTPTTGSNCQSVVDLCRDDPSDRRRSRCSGSVMTLSES